MAIRRHYINNGTVVSTVGSMSNSATTVTVSDASSFPGTFPWTAVIDAGLATAEVVLVTAATGALLTITRGYDGTAAQTHASAATFAHAAVQADYDEANAHVTATSAVHGISGAVVGTTDVQTLTNKTVAGLTATGTIAGANETLSGTLTVTGAAALNGGVTTTTVTASGAVNAASVAATGSISAASIAGVAAQSVAVPGAVTMFAGSAAPTGWQLCDGTAISRTTFAALFAVVGTTYGVGDGSTTFNVPNLQDNFAVGKSGTKALGAVGGSTSHNHPMSSNAWAQMNPFTGAYGANLKSTGVTAWNENTRTSGTTGTPSNGVTRGVPLDGVTDTTTALPPYVALNFIIKT